MEALEKRQLLAVSVLPTISLAAGGDAVSELTVGDTFYLNVYVQDTRETPLGVSTGVVDVVWDATLADPTGTADGSAPDARIAFDSDYSQFQQGAIDDAAGLLDEVGATTTTTGLGAGSATLLFSVQMTATDDGTLVFATEAADGTGAYYTDPRFALVGEDAVDFADVTFQTASVTINETNSVSIASTQSGDEAGPTDGSFTVSLATASSVDTVVSYSVGGTATSASDYTALSGTVTIPAGDLSAAIGVPVIDDDTVELAETVVVTLTGVTSGVSGAVLDSTASEASLQIADNDSATLSIASDFQEEGDADTSTLSFVVSLSAPVDTDVSVTLDTADGTATVADGDYTALDGQVVTIAAGQTSATVTVSATGDTKYEADETFTLNVTSLSAGGRSVTLASGDDSIGTGTIENDDEAPTVSIADVTLAEGNSSTTAFVFTVTLSSESGQDVVVNYETVSDTATAGADYTAASGQATIAAGQTTAEITVYVTGDVTDEVNETFRLDLLSASNATLADASATGTITDDDTAPTVSISGPTASITEGDSGSTTATFTLTLSEASGQTVSVTYATSDGTASADDDYTAASGTVTFEPGQTEKTLTVAVLGDQTDEADETFYVALTSVESAILDIDSAEATVLDDDAAPSVSVGDISASEGNSGTTQAGFTVALSAASGQTITLNYTITGGTATAGTDFTASSGTITFDPGDTQKTISVPVIGDTVDESDETFTLTLTADTGAPVSLDDATATGTILDDDEAITIAIADISVEEGDEGTTDAVFTVILSEASTEDIVLSFLTEDGTATAGSDYTGTSGTVTIEAGETEATFTVPVLGDTTYDPNETFLANLTIQSGTGVSLADDSATATIVDDDGVTVSIADVTVDESAGTMTFEVSLSDDCSEAVTVYYATADGTATAGTDYTSASGSVTIAAGDRTATFTVPILSDTADEADETLTVTLSLPDDAVVTLSDAEATGTITDNDPGPTITISDLTAAEGDSGNTAYTITVTLSEASQRAITLTYDTVAGTALADVDFTALALQSVVIAAGETTAEFTVYVTGDTTDEDNETFTLDFTAPDDVTLTDGENGDGVFTVAITDDDDPPTATLSDVTVTEGDSGSVNATFTITLSEASGHDITFTYSTADGTATAGNDYTSGSGTVTIYAGSTTAEVTIPVLADTVVESSETFTLTVTAEDEPVTLEDDELAATATITDNDELPTITVDDVEVDEGDSGTTTLTFTITLSEASDEDITVAYTTAASSDDDAATAGTDYTSASGTVTIEAGETTATVTITITGDTDVENDELFSFVLSEPTNAKFADDADTITATATILDDDTEEEDGTASISGSVWLDLDNDGVFDESEIGIPGVEMLLYSVDDDENTELVESVITGDDGSYSFTGLAAGTYQVNQNHPEAYLDGLDVVGTIDDEATGTMTDGQITDIVLADGDEATDYNFGEIGLSAGYIGRRMLLSTMTSRSAFLRELMAEAADDDGDTDLADRIRGTSTATDEETSDEESTSDDSSDDSSDDDSDETSSSLSDAAAALAASEDEDNEEDDEDSSTSAVDAALTEESDWTD